MQYAVNSTQEFYSEHKPWFMYESGRINHWSCIWQLSEPLSSEALLIDENFTSHSRAHHCSGGICFLLQLLETATSTQWQVFSSNFWYRTLLFQFLMSPDCIYSKNWRLSLLRIAKSNPRPLACSFHHLLSLPAKGFPFCIPFKFIQLTQIRLNI